MLNVQLTKEQVELLIRFVDAVPITATLPVDGAYIKIAQVTLSGVSTRNSTPTATGTTYTISTGTWYRCKSSSDFWKPCHLLLVLRHWSSTVVRYNHNQHSNFGW
jgi:hypothetical protein